MGRFISFFINLLFLQYCNCQFDHDEHNLLHVKLLFYPIYIFLIKQGCQLQCLPQFLQLPPHCSDFPAFLSRIILRIINTTMINNTMPVMSVPIIISPFAQYLTYFANAFVFILMLNVLLSL